MDAQATCIKRLDRIESALCSLHAMMEQERADVGKLGWPAAGSLGYVAAKLEEIEDFWGAGEHSE